MACEKALWLRQRDGRIPAGVEVASHDTTLLNDPDYENGVNVLVTLTNGTTFDLQFELSR